MSSIGKLSIRSRLLCLALLLVAVLLGLTVFLAHKLSTNTSGIEEEAEVVSILTSATSATKDFGDLKHWLMDAAPTLLKDSNEQLQRTKQRFASDLQRIEAIVPGSAQRIKGELERLMAHASKAMEAYTGEQRAIGNSFMALARAHIAEIDRELQTVVDQLEHRAVARRDSAIQSLRATTSLSILAAILAIIVVAVITALIISSITRPLRRLERSVSAIIAGRLNFDLPEAGQDEIGKMAKALSMWRDNLLERHRLEELRKSAESVGAVAQRQHRDAIDTISDGFALYDNQDRLAICNAAYREIYGHAGLNIEPGVTYEEVVRAACGGFAADQATEARLTARVRRRHQRVGNYETVNIRGRWINIRERPTADGGIVGIYSDVRQSQQVGAQDLSVYKTQIPELAEAPGIASEDAALVAMGSPPSAVGVQFQSNGGRRVGTSLGLISQSDERVALVPDEGATHARSPRMMSRPRPTARLRRLTLRAP
jgi:adenylate cyclase